MDVNMMTTQEREYIMRKGLCFGCKEPGHISRNCPKMNQGRTPPSPPPQKKWKGKELHAHIKMLVTQMEDDDANTFFEEAAKEGF